MSHRTIVSAVAALLVSLGFSASAQTPPAAPAPVPTQPALQPGEAAGRALLSDSFIDQARRRVHTSNLPPELAANEAFALLQLAQRLTPDDPDMLRRLAAAAIATNNPDMAREAYRQLIKIEPDNLVAQVLFLEAVAHGKPVEQQIKIYQAAADKTELNTQVRSEMALHVGNLLLQRGQGDEGMKALQQSIALNDVNVGAWQEVARYLSTRNASPVDRMSAITGLLMANPYQPDAIASAAHLLSATGNHDLAGDYLNAAIEQLRYAGFQVPANNYMEVAFELALANHRGEAAQLLTDLSNLPNAPLSVPLCLLLLRNADNPGAAPAPVPATDPATTAPALTNDSLLDQMRKAEQAGITADPKSAFALIDAIWAELLVAPSPIPETADRFAALKTIVGEGNPTYVRLLGWKLLREGKSADALAALEPLSSKDTLAMLGMIRLWAAAGKTVEVKSHLQDLQNAQPESMLSLLLKLESERNQITLDAPPFAQAMRDAAAKYPRTMLLAQRNPHDLVILTPTLAKRRYGLGESIILSVTATNQTDHALAVGPTAPVSTQLAIAGRLRGFDAQDLGAFAFASEPRIYRIERHSTITQTIRVDQGLLRDLLYTNPTRLFSLGLSLITAPHEAGQQFVPGLGGQRVIAGEFEREGLSITSGEQLLAILRDLPRLPLDRQMILGAMLEAIVYNLPEDNGAAPGTAPAPGTVTMADVRRQIIDSLLQQLKTGHPVVQAWLLRQAPPRDLPPVIIKALEDLQDSPNSTIRMVAYDRALALQRNDAIRSASLVDVFTMLSRRDPDPLASRWASLLSEEAKLPPPQPATAPAPTTSPAGG